MLEIRDGQLVALARTIAQDGGLVDLEYMRRADAEALLLFLERKQRAEELVISFSLA